MENKKNGISVPENRRIWNRIENKKEYPDAVYYLFSDEVDWCEAHYAELGFTDGDEIEFVKGNVDGANYIDLFLMSKCRGVIMSNSSFSYLAALLNKGLEFFVNPSNVRLL